MQLLTPLLIGYGRRDTMIVVRLLLILVLALATLPAYAEDWTTSDGKSYQNVKVVKVEDDAVTILCNDGGALVPLSKLSPTLQKRFSYDPVKAKAAAATRADGDAKNAQQLQAEFNQAELLKQQQRIQNAKQIGDGKAATGTTPPPPTTP